MILLSHAYEPLNGSTCATPPGVDDHVRSIEVLVAIRHGQSEAGLTRVGDLGLDSNTYHYWPLPHRLKQGAATDRYLDNSCTHQYHSTSAGTRSARPCTATPSE